MLHVQFSHILTYPPGNLNEKFKKNGETTNTKPQQAALDVWQWCNAFLLCHPCLEDHPIGNMWLITMVVYGDLNRPRTGEKIRFLSWPNSMASLNGFPPNSIRTKLGESSSKWGPFLPTFLQPQLIVSRETAEDHLKASECLKIIEQTRSKNVRSMYGIWWIFILYAIYMYIYHTWMLRVIRYIIPTKKKLLLSTFHWILVL